jgi:hypothetical protein
MLLHFLADPLTPREYRTDLKSIGFMCVFVGIVIVVVIWWLRR